MALSLKDFYHRIIKNKIPYCMVCLRTEKERFLTDCNRYTIFAKNCIPLKAQGLLYNRDNGGQVCRTCDGWLRRGLEVMNAVVESKNANYYFSNLSEGRDANPPVLPQLENTRRNWSLNATETLVISTDVDLPSEPSSEPQSTVTVTHEKDCVVIIEHDITNMSALAQSNDIHSVVTLEDSDDESTKAPRRIASKELLTARLDNGLSITPVPPTTVVDANIIGPQGLLIPVMNVVCPANTSAPTTPNFCMPFNMTDNANYAQQRFMISGFPAVVTVNNCETNTITGDISYNSSVIEINEIPQSDKPNGRISEVCSKADTTKRDVVIDANCKKDKRKFNILSRNRDKHKTYPSGVKQYKTNSTESAGPVEIGEISPSAESSETHTPSKASCSKRKVAKALPEKQYRFNRKTKVIEVSESTNSRSFVQVPKETPAASVEQNVDWEDEIPMDVIAYDGHKIQFSSR